MSLLVARHIPEVVDDPYKEMRPVAIYTCRHCSPADGSAQFELTFENSTFYEVDGVPGLSHILTECSCNHAVYIFNPTEEMLAVITGKVRERCASNVEIRRAHSVWLDACLARTVVAQRQVGDLEKDPNTFWSVMNGGADTSL